MYVTQDVLGPTCFSLSCTARRVSGLFLYVCVLGKAGSRRMNRSTASESERITGRRGGGCVGMRSEEQCRVVFPKANNYFLFSQVSPRTSFGFQGCYFFFFFYSAGQQY